MRNRSIVCVYVDQPNPYGNDWYAHDDNWEPGYPFGCGNTAEEAVSELLERLDEWNEAWQQAQGERLKIAIDKAKRHG
jgi:hypothetical protein